MLRPWTFSGLVLVPLGLVAPSSAFADECGPVEEVQFWTRENLGSVLDPDYQWRSTSEIVMNEHWTPIDVAIVVRGGCPARFLAYGGKLYSGWSLAFPFLVDFEPARPDEPFYEPERPSFVALTSTQINPWVGDDPVAVVIFDDAGTEIANVWLPFVVVDHVPDPYVYVTVLQEDGWEIAEVPYNFLVGDSIYVTVLDVRTAWDGPDSRHVASLLEWSDIRGLPEDLRLEHIYVIKSRDAGTWDVRGEVFDDDGNEVPVSSTIQVRRCDCNGVAGWAAWMWGFPAIAALFRRRR